MAQKEHSRTSGKKWKLRQKPAAEDRELILQRRVKIASAVQYAKKNPDFLSSGQVLTLQRTIGNKATRRLVNRNGKSARLKQNTVGRLSSNDLRVQRKLKLTGGNKKIRARFMKKMNEGRVAKFELDGSGFIKLKKPKAKGRHEYSRQMISAVKDPQTVNLRLIKKSDVVFVDSFASGEVDYNDMFRMSKTMFQLNLLHYVVERFAMKDYETKKTTASAADFDKAHKAGLESEEKYMKQLFPGKTIKYKSAGFDPKSKKVDKKGNGTIRYIFDFTDVKEIFIQPIVGGAIKENIVKTIVKVVK